MQHKAAFATSSCHALLVSASKQNHFRKTGGPITSKHVGKGYSAAQILNKSCVMATLSKIQWTIRDISQMAQHHRIPVECLEQI